jgi:hypothetical protein
VSLDISLLEGRTASVFEGNITHNLNRMAQAAGIYKHMWRPEEIGVKKAGQLIVPLREGLFELLAHPDEYEKLAPDNGWGTYDQFVEFVRRYLAACEAHPKAKVVACR